MANSSYPSVYRPVKWFALADNLAKLLKNNATDAWLAYAGHEAFEMGDDSSDFIFNNDARSGADFLTQDRASFLESTILPIVNVSIFGPSENIDYYTKQQWVVPRTTTFTPQTRVRTAHPILLISMSLDPICPLISAKTTQKVFEESRLVVIKGVGHCSVSMPSTCAAKHIRAYLYDGVLPHEQQTECQVDRPYFVAPEHEGEVDTLQRRGLESAEHVRIRRAQMQLARDWQWKVGPGGWPMPM